MNGLKLHSQCWEIDPYTAKNPSLIASECFRHFIPELQETNWEQVESDIENVLLFRLVEENTTIAVAGIFVQRKKIRSTFIISPIAPRRYDEIKHAMAVFEATYSFIFSCDVCDDCTCSLFLMENDVRSIAAKMTDWMEVVHFKPEDEEEKEDSHNDLYV